MRAGRRTGVLDPYEALAAISELIDEAVALLRQACSSQCALDICVELEDELVVLMDAARGGEWVDATTVRVASLASDRLLHWSHVLGGKECSRESSLVRKAGLLLGEAAELGEKLIYG